MLGELPMNKKHYFSTFELAFVIIAFLALSITSFYFNSGILSYICTVFGIFGGVLNMKASKFSYIFAFISCAIYVYISFKQKYYGEAIQNLCYICPMYIYSIIKWTVKGDKSKENKDIYNLSKNAKIALIPIIIAITFIYGYILGLIGTRYEYINALSTALNVTTCFLCAKRAKQQWYFWVSNNLVLILLWALSTSNTTAGIPIITQNILFLISNCNGLYLWNFKYKNAYSKKENN